MWIAVGLVILILVAILLPVISDPRHPRIMKARTEMRILAAAVQGYEQLYGHLPLANLETDKDLTLGISPADIRDFTPIRGTRLVATNSDLVTILMDLDRGLNTGHKLNPQQVEFLNATMVEGTNSQGVSVIDYQYRDPWGQPYIVSLDVNHDGFVRDAFYAATRLYGNGATTPLTNRNGFYEFAGRVMVWSRGRDAKVNSSQPADGGVNKDNELSWR
jgi:hypothetical protein